MSVEGKLVNELTTTTPAINDIALGTELASPTVLKRSTWQAVYNLFKGLLDTAYNSTYARLTGVNTFSGDQTINSDGQVLNINGATHSYIAWLVAGVRKFYIGMSAAGRTNLTIANEISGGDVTISTNGGNFEVNGQNWTSAWTSYTPSALMTSGSGASFTVYGAKISPIGKKLFINLDLGVASKGTASGDFGIINPFSAVSTFMSGGIYRGTTQIGLLPQANGTTIKVVKTAGVGVLQWSDITAGDLIYMSGCIEIA